MAAKALHARWTRLASAEILQRSSQTIAAADGSCYVFGGELRPREPRDGDVYAFGVAAARGDKTGAAAQVTNVAASSSDSPPPRVGAASTTLNGKFYLFSGRGGLAMKPIEEHGALWVFDTAARSWSTLSPAASSSSSSSSSPAEYPEARSYHAMTNDGRDTLFLHAGCPEKGRLSDLWSFRVSQRRWTRHADAPDPPRGGPSVAFVAGKLYRMNGFDGKTEQGGAVDVFDVAGAGEGGDGAWGTHAFEANSKAGPEARSVSALVAVKVGGRDVLVTCFGERDPSSLGHEGAGKMLKDVWAFDVLDREWSRVDVQGDGGGAEAMPDARGWFAAEAAGEGAVVVQGGLGEANNRLGDAWLLQF